MYPVPFHSRMIYFYPHVSDSSYHVHCCSPPRHSHPVRSEPQGPSLWLSCRHRRRPWRARTALSSPRCTGERRFSATAPPSWPAVWTCGEEESLSHAQRVRRVHELVDCDEWTRCWRGRNNTVTSFLLLQRQQVHFPLGQLYSMFLKKEINVWSLFEYSEN